MITTRYATAEEFLSKGLTTYHLGAMALEAERGVNRSDSDFHELFLSEFEPEDLTFGPKDEALYKRKT